MEGHSQSFPCLRWVGVDIEQIIGRAQLVHLMEMVLFEYLYGALRNPTAPVRRI